MSTEQPVEQQQVTTTPTTTRVARYSELELQLLPNPLQNKRIQRELQWKDN